MTVDVDADAIPKELKDRDQWLLWDDRADRPRQPHWDGDHSISWSDPDDWHSFAEAIELAREHEHWGVGYVMAAENPDHARGLYRCVDIDGGVEDVTEDGVELADWVPDLDALADDYAYVEVSPSGTGLHIPFVGNKPPQWWRDCQLDDHTGVDVLENKFCTFTGDTLPESGDSVSEEPPAAWLFDAYKAINGETPRIAPSSSEESRNGYDGDGLSEDAVEDALSHLSADCSYEKWRDIGFAVHDWDDGSTGRSLFEQWSRRGSKWDSQAERTVDWIWENASQGSGVTVATLVHHAKQAGWSPPSSNRSKTDSDSTGSQEGKSSASGVSSSGSADWSWVRGEYEESKARGRKAAADALEDMTDWMYVMESERLWVYDDDRGYFSPWGEEYVRKVLESEVYSFYSSRDAKEVAGRIEARNQTRRKTLNARTRDTPLLCVGNGVVDLSSGELLDHSPEYKFTRGLEVDYEPAQADPEPVLEFLDDVTKREADRDTLLDHLAHGLMPGHPYRAFVIMYGPGSNGKTRVGRLFRGFVGEDNAAAVELQELTGDDDFATGALPGAFINVGDDVSVGEIRDVSTLKSITGGGTMRANRKHEQKFDFTNEAAMFFSANEPPRIREASEAIGDRLYPIEMPYRFVDNPSGELEKQKESGVAEALLEDDEAMRGLLLLAVKHAQDVIERNGEYSMPEGPSERREMYEAASDPIKRFALDYLTEASDGAAIVKDDAYTVYTEFCDKQGERAASQDVFKQEVSRLASLNIESGQSRALTPGDSRDRVWKYVEFDGAATEFMPPRLKNRYADAEDLTVEESSDDGNMAFGATALSRAPEALSGYVTVTAEVRALSDLGETDGVKAVLVDETGAMDLVAWEPSVADDVRALEGETVAIENAEVTEYEGTRQLQPVEGITSFTVIQPGVGYSEGAEADGDQSDLAGSATPDGGATVRDSSLGDVDETDDEPSTDADVAALEPPADAEGRQANAERVAATVEAADETLLDEQALTLAVADRYDSLTGRISVIEHALEAAVEEYGLLIETEDGYRRP